MSCNNCCCKCLSGIFLTIIAVLTMGVISALFIAALVIVKLKKLDVVSDELYYGLIGGAAGSLLLLFFGIYASICGKKCSKTVLAILYLLFAAGLCTGGVFLSMKGDSIMDHCEQIWTDEKLAEARNSLEKVFKCCGYKIPLPHCITDLNPPCYYTIGDYIKKYKNYVGYGIFVLSFLVLVAAITALVVPYCVNANNKDTVVYHSF